jgi:hypothetical protein
MLIAAGIINAAAVSADNAFTVDKAIFDINVTPGVNLPQTITLSSDPTANPLDVNVETDGLGQTRQGATMELAAADDTPFSARTYITNITPATFHIGPGKSVTINFSINVPANAAPGEKYAVMRIYSNPYGIGQGAAAVVAVDIPFILNVGGAVFKPAGQISGLTVTNAVTGAPLEIQSTLLNTGTVRIPAVTTINRQVIKDSSGNTVVAQTDYPVDSPSIVPSYERTITAHPGPANGLPVGDYSLVSSFLLADNTVLDSHTLKFSVTPPPTVTGPGGENLILPNMNPNSLVIANYDDKQQGADFYVDATDKAGVEVEVQGAAGFGAIIIGSYSSAPNVAIPFSAPVAQGGTGKSVFQFVDVRTPGFTQGTAFITVHYTPQQIAGFDPASLMLAYFNGSTWTLCSNITVNNTLGTVTGNCQVLALTGTVIGMGGNLLQAGKTTPTTGNNTSQKTTANGSNNAPITPAGTSVPWSLFGIIIGALVIVGLVVFVVLGQRKKRAGN